MGARHGYEFSRAIQTDGLMAQRLEMLQITSRAASQIENTIGVIAFDRF
jgi:hypothetical protein